MAERAESEALNTSMTVEQVSIGYVTGQSVAMGYDTRQIYVQASGKV